MRRYGYPRVNYKHFKISPSTEIYTKSVIQKVRKTINSRGLFPPINDYSADIKEKSAEIMDLFKYQIEQSVDRIGYVLTENLHNQIHYIFLTEKIAFMESIYEKFSKKLEEIEDKLQE